MEDLNDINLPHDDENGNPRLSQAQEFKGVNKPCPVTRGSRRGRGHPGRGRGPRTRSLESDLVPYPSHYTRSRRQSMPAEATFYNHHDMRKMRLAVQKCGFCSFTCKLVKDLIVHSESEHPGEKYCCTECSFKGFSLAKLKKHQSNYKHYSKEKIQETPETNGNLPRIILLPKHNKLTKIKNLRSRRSN